MKNKNFLVKTILSLVFLIIVLNFVSIEVHSIPPPKPGIGSLNSNANQVNHKSETPLTKEAYKKMRIEEIKGKMDYRNSKLFKICNKNNLTLNCTKGPINFNVYNKEIIPFVFNNKMHKISFLIEEGSYSKKNGSVTKHFKYPYSKVRYDNFQNENLNISEGFNFGAYFKLNFTGVNNSNYITNKYLTTESFSLIISPEYFCKGIWINETCQEDNSIFMFDGKEYTIINGSIRDYKKIIDKNNFSTNKTENESVLREIQNQKITGNIISEDSPLKSFFQRILRFFGIREN